MALTLTKLSPATRDDFHRLHCPENDAGWCYCVAWWVPTWAGWNERSAAENRRLREALFGQGEYDGFLLYDDGEPAGWCQVGPRDRLDKLVQQFQLSPDPGAWAITCFLVAPGRRRQGFARHLLRGVMDQLRAQGVRRVEAFPKRGPELDAEDLWNGPEALFRDAGFQIARDDPKRPWLATTL